ncbi:MAG TPA: Rieske 2Fe-2S domain-containing protein [Pirellulales bacterium]|nr:Rieske 2Fe-2S domain-containing protein [Pirellulales bacterium]
MFHRRSMLKWISGALGTASAAVITLPGAHFLAEALRPHRRGQAIVQRVARLRDLSPGRPLQVAVVGSRRDAWTLYPEEVVGRVWLVRQPDDADGGRPPRVAAFTAVCPHLGCTIQLAPPGGRFICPCHRAEFSLDGAPSAGPGGKKSHAPRGMDELDCRLVRDSHDGDWWVEVTYEKFEQGLTSKVSKA